jgi:uncharacterized protein (TIRG00374 family)
MGKRRNLVYGVVASILAALVYMQFRSWRGFDWASFWGQTHQINTLRIANAIGLTYLAYAMRALRWRVFLRPVRRETTVGGLLAPTLIGFSGLAMFGRPGELIRPYLIARKEHLTFSSQLAVWAVERIFDLGAFALLLILAIFFAVGQRELRYYGSFRRGGFILAGLVAILALTARLVSQKGGTVADWVENGSFHLAFNPRQKIALRIREFQSGMNAIRGTSSLLQLITISLAMWYTIALACQQVTASYGVEILRIPVSKVFVLLGSSMVGSLIQLPGVGGGSQLATIATLERVFDVPPELAASCGILLWLVSFVSVIPLGLLLAHKERLSLWRLSEESQEEEISSTL